MSVVDDIRAKLDIVEVVAPYVTFQQSGRTLKANCPFHTERTPSFVVSPERQSWRCFGACAVGGDIFSFVMRAENMEFRDALKTLAQKAGVELQPSRVRAASNAAQSANNAAAEFYQEVLNSDRGKLARDYLDDRGVSQEARDKFQLGLSPDSWDGLVQHFKTFGVTREAALGAGLVRQTDDGRPYDFFRGRLMFPICDRDGNVIGFGARALDDSNPKYINTAATEAFDKRNTLYALHMATARIRQTGTAVIVEGYMDAIAAHEHGFSNVVASMGTALTENQVSQLRSLAQSYVLALDPDAAGQEATLRSLESSWRVFRSTVARRSPASQSVLSQYRPPELKIAELPEGQDPDALIRNDSQKWEETVAGAQPLLDYVIPALITRTDLSVQDNVVNIVSELARLINQLEDSDQYPYLEKLSSQLNIPIEILRASIGGRGGSQTRRRNGGAESQHAVELEVSESMLRSEAADTLEEYVLALLVQHSQLLEDLAEADPQFFRHSENRQLFTMLLTCPTIGELREGLDSVLAGLLGRLEQLELPPMSSTELQFVRNECLSRLEERHLRDFQFNLLQTDGPEVAPQRELTPQVQQVNRRLRELHSTGRK
ncbi:MAG: DNA primase [Dehalococcoidia bacterium]|nr:DNA primase [Dehalococcoidia bacterium]